MPGERDELFEQVIGEMQERNRRKSGFLDNLQRFSPEYLRDLIERRLTGRPTPELPGMGRDGELTDVFVTASKTRPGIRDVLTTATAAVARDWFNHDDETIGKNPKPYGEIVYMCSEMNMGELVPELGSFAGRDGLAQVALPSNEDMQGFALRGLAGLLISQPEEVRARHRSVYERALGRKNHVAIALTTLVDFWPTEKAGFVSQAKQHNEPIIDSLIKDLDFLTQFFKQNS